MCTVLVFVLKLSRIFLSGSFNYSAWEPKACVIFIAKYINDAHTDQNQDHLYKTSVHFEVDLSKLKN